MTKATIDVEEIAVKTPSSAYVKVARSMMARRFP
jgi:hypothetical protein